ncbi:MAG TPA: TlpA disulfide reductase family protein [Bryobacteraceae bacterium]|nr:TlpA disulfide reductase family protein [Bryobacteraceae bacterium]
MKKTFVISAAVAVAAGCLLLGDTSALRKAPELAFNIPGQGQKLLSQYRGKVVALEFILTTCPHCQAASRVMTKFQEEYGPRGLETLDLAINALDENRTPADADAMATAFQRNFQVGFPVGWIARDQMMAFMGFSMAERMVVPQLVLIDRKGYIHYQTPAGDSEDWTKLMSEDAIRQHIEELLALNTSASKHGSTGSKVAMAKKGS